MWLTDLVHSVGMTYDSSSGKSTKTKLLQRSTLGSHNLYIDAVNIVLYFELCRV